MNLLGFAVTVGDYLLPLVQLFAGLGAFLIGVKIMSDSMTKLTNSGLRKMFQRIDNNKLAGVGIGAGATAIIQSSAVTTVMVVGFVNAGVMSLNQATTVIMGANIGTTVTAQLAALQGFDFMQYAILLTIVGMLVMSIAKTEKIKTFGHMIAGLGLMFLSLRFMSSAMSPFTGEGELAESVQNFLAAISNPVLLLLIGIVLTFLLQSSAALTTILISMAAAGLIIGGNSSAVGNGALYVILGSNIGTCFTTMLASANASANAKRAALIHLLFNLLGSLLFFIVLVCWPKFMDDTFVRLFPDAPGTQLAMFHTLFNVTCTLLFLPFSKLFVKVTSFVVREKKGEHHTAMYIDDRFLSTPSVAIVQAVKEFRSISDFIIQTCDIAFDGFMKKDPESEKKVLDRIAESIEVSQQLTKYMINISAHGTDIDNENDLSRLYHALGDIMRVSDLAHNITKYTRHVVAGEAAIAQTGYDELSAMYAKIRELYPIALDCFEHKRFSLLNEVERREDEIDNARRDMIDRHIARLKKGECDPSGNGVFINLTGNLERMGDHLTFIAESITQKAEEIVAS